MMLKIINDIRYMNLNLYAICVDSIDDYERNNITLDVIKNLERKGIHTVLHIAQGTIFGYVVCKKCEVNRMAEVVSLEERCKLNKVPVNFLMKRMIIHHSLL